VTEVFGELCSDHPFKMRYVTSVLVGFNPDPFMFDLLQSEIETSLKKRNSK